MQSCVSSLLVLFLCCGAEASSFTATCTQDAGWTYVVDYHDDRSRDDFPDTEEEIASGFADLHSMYVGNVKLAALEFDEVSVCVAQPTKNCEEVCYTLDEHVSYVCVCPKASNLGSEVKNFIGGMAGTCTSATSGLDVSQCTLYSQDLGENMPTKDIGCDPILWESTPVGQWGQNGQTFSWHFSGWGPTMSIKGLEGDDNKELGFLAGCTDHHTSRGTTAPHDWDSFRIRVRNEGEALEQPLTNTSTTTSTHTASTTSSTTRSTSTTSSATQTETSIVTVTNTSTVTVTNTSTTIVGPVFVDEAMPRSVQSMIVLGLTVFNF